MFCLQGVLSDELYSTTDPDELACRIAIVELLIARKIEAKNKRQNPDAMYNLSFSPATFSSLAPSLKVS